MTDTFQTKLDEIRVRFILALDAQRQIVHEAICSIKTGQNQEGALRAARLELHNIAGTAAIFGFHNLGALATYCEGRIADPRQDIMELNTILSGVLDAIDHIKKTS